MNDDIVERLQRVGGPGGDLIALVCADAAKEVVWLREQVALWKSAAQAFEMGLFDTGNLLIEVQETTEFSVGIAEGGSYTAPVDANHYHRRVFLGTTGEFAKRPVVGADICMGRLSGKFTWFNESPAMFGVVKRHFQSPLEDVCQEKSIRDAG